MFVVPPPNPFTVPVREPIVATPVLLLVQVPPPGVLVIVCVDPKHIGVVPTIGVGERFTVCTLVVKQPETFIRYVITDVPVATPATTPLPLPIVATVKSEELHVPEPVVLLVRPTLTPAHCEDVPVIANGCGYTLRTVVNTAPGKL